MEFLHLFECRSKFGDSDGKYMNYCIACGREVKKQENKVVNRKRKQNTLPSRQFSRGGLKRSNRVSRNKK